MGKFQVYSRKLSIATYEHTRELKIRLIKLLKKWKSCEIFSVKLNNIVYRTNGWIPNRVRFKSQISNLRWSQKRLPVTYKLIADTDTWYYLIYCQEGDCSTAKEVISPKRRVVFLFCCDLVRIAGYWRWWTEIACSYTYRRTVVTARIIHQLPCLCIYRRRY